MTRKRRVGTLSDKKQKRYERIARLQYGPQLVNESIDRWNGYTKAEREAILQEGSQIYSDLARAAEAGLSAQGSQVQAIVQRWHEHLRHFYEPTLDILRGLGEAYRSEPGFTATFKKLHPDLPETTCLTRSRST
jgi:hypothetical protein